MTSLLVQSLPCAVTVIVTVIVILSNILTKSVVCFNRQNRNNSQVFTQCWMSSVLSLLRQLALSNSVRNCKKILFQTACYVRTDQIKYSVPNVFFTNNLNMTTFRKKQIFKFVAGKNKFRVLNFKFN